jgi:hypothetical protein
MLREFFETTFSELVKLLLGHTLVAGSKNLLLIRIGCKVVNGNGDFLSSRKRTKAEKSSKEKSRCFRWLISSNTHDRWQVFIAARIEQQHLGRLIAALPDIFSVRHKK